MIAATDPPMSAKVFQLVCLSTFWGMQIWVTFISGLVMGSNLTRHTYGFIQSRLFPYYLHLGSACAFFNLIVFAMYHPRDELTEDETTQLLVLLTTVTVAALNAQWFGQLTSEIMADMHLMEQSYGLGQDIGLCSRKAYLRLRDSDPKYKKMAQQLRFYGSVSSLCNLCCIVCNSLNLYYTAGNLSTL
ncbi:transmembrane protein 205 [Microcaecilia unicolor]|uniref:Transmembrane protein 205-like n=1 Tax=Microcaecilia unicolor TaxID=1415580 RepID=A0A6P7YAQ2_9AMPH|nr:transmembrane protein 205-like [Microcaecilia unicolor]XP_030062118.1 transmembrane protein 205-like [Microcaecilia unicolor]XP_030062119.1 transmembrane protein 205-like [Microcaecilia unicolor]